MAQKIKTLYVLPNPSHALDADGKPACAIQFENSGGGYWVGATIDHKASQAEGRTVFVFDEVTVVPVPCTGYYARKILDDELLAADDESAKLAGIPEDDDRRKKFRAAPARAAKASPTPKE